MGKDPAPAPATVAADSKPLVDKEKLIAVGVGIIVGAVLHNLYAKYKAEAAPAA